MLFFFIGFLPFELIGLPHFWCTLDSFAIILADCPIKNSIHVGAFIVSI